MDMDATKGARNDEREELPSMQRRVDRGAEVRRPALLEIEPLDLSEVSLRAPIRSVLVKMNELVAAVNELRLLVAQSKERE